MQIPNSIHVARIKGAVNPGSRCWALKSRVIQVAISPLPNRGISADGLHLSVYGGPRCIRVCDPNTCAPACQPASFTQAGLQYGYNVRNLITVTALGRLSSLQRSIRSEG